MPEIKISEMPELTPFDNFTLEGGVNGADLLPILDISELDVTLQNKKVSIQTIFEDYTRLYNNGSNTYSPKFIPISKIVLTNNLFNLNSLSELFNFIDPNGVNRSINIILFGTGENRYIKNVSFTNTIDLSNMVTNNGNSVYPYTINPTKTVRIIFDGDDHHVIALD